MSGHTETAQELSVIDSKLWAEAVKYPLYGKPIWIFFADHRESMDYARAALQAYLVELRRKDDSDQRIIAELRAALDKCATRFESCIIRAGSSAEVAAVSVEAYRALAKAAS